MIRTRSGRVNRLLCRLFGHWVFNRTGILEICYRCGERRGVSVRV